MSSDLGNIKATKDIHLQPNETRTVIGFYRKKTNFKSAVTEQIESSGTNALICPRIVTLPGKNTCI